MGQLAECLLIRPSYITRFQKRAFLQVGYLLTYHIYYVGTYEKLPLFLNNGNFINFTLSDFFLLSDLAVVELESKE